jgi:uncharacterized protein DUF1275
MLAAIRHEMADVTTGLYMISAICGLVDAVCFLVLGGVFAEMMTGNLLLMAFSIGWARRSATARATSRPSCRSLPARCWDRSRLDRLAGDGRQSEANGCRPGAIASVGCAQPSVPSHTPKEHPN